jgi:predicted TIM-barrel fold metal-dependent hydrolase
MSQEQSTSAGGTPRKALPSGSCDTHAHVFGPYERFPLADPRPYTPGPAPKGDYLAMLNAAGFDRGVLVHGGANGWDHRAMLDAIASAPGRLRGIGVLPGSASDSDLSALGAGGVRGLRFTEVAGPTASQNFAGRVGFDALYELAPRLRELGWQAVIWANADALASACDSLRKLELPLVIDHLGYFDVTRGVNDAAFQSLLSLVRDGVAWVKLTAFRNSKGVAHYADVRPFHDALVRANPERLLWGSDWPFLGMSANRPDVGRLLDLLDEWLGDDSVRDKILVTNPAVLYGFG